MKSRFLIALTIIFLTVGVRITAQANKNRLWNNKRCAVVLTYDDATDVHLNNVIPVLDSLNLKATFYVPGHSESLAKRLPEWRALAKDGHELGNHTIFHPCHGKSKGREWVNSNYDLDNYTLKRIEDEIAVNNTLLQAIDGKTVRTFAYTCGDLTAGGESFVPAIKKEFIAARGVQPGTNRIDDADLYNLKIFSVRKGTTVKQMIDAVNQARKERTLLIFLFHGVGGGNPYSCSTSDLSKLAHHLKENEDKIWIAPMVEVASFIDDYRGK